MTTQITKPDLVERLWESDAASALTNEAAREIRRLRAEVIFYEKMLTKFEDAFLEQKSKVKEMQNGN